MQAAKVEENAVVMTGQPPNRAGLFAHSLAILDKPTVNLRPKILPAKQLQLLIEGLQMKHILALGFILAAASATTAQANDKFTIPTDPGVTYTVIHQAKIGDSAVLATIRNSKVGGISMSSRLFNCSAGTFKYLADEDGAENAERFMQQHNAAMDSLNESGLSPVSPGSISSYLLSYACKPS